MCVHLGVWVGNGILLSYFKKNEYNEIILPFEVLWMDLEIIILSEDREKQIYDITYM